MTWVYEQHEPMATYLATVQIGRYDGRRRSTAPVPTYAVLARTAAPGRFDAAFGRRPR